MEDEVQTVGQTLSGLLGGSGGSQQALAVTGPQPGERRGTVALRVSNGTMSRSSPCSCCGR
jgi:hypothetical protein